MASASWAGSGSVSRCSWPSPADQERQAVPAGLGQRASAAGRSAVPPGSSRTVKAALASSTASAGASPGMTRWIAPICGGYAAESTSSARP